MLSDQEWETWPFEDEASGFEKFTDESAEPPDQTNATKQTNETLQKLQLLCRVCGSSGLINIKSAISRSTMKVKQSGDLTKWNVSIAQVIQDISGEPVSTSDNLPQFICQHCLGYLEHAFAMRLQMRAYSATVRFYIDLAENEPRQAAEADFNQSAKTTKAEISEFEDEINDESHFHSHFEGAAISIAPSTSKQFSQRVIEHKCQSCNKRVMSITSLNKHLEHCEMSIFGTLYSQFQNLYKMKVASALTTLEFIMHAIKIIDNTHKKIQDIMRIKNIDVSTITSEQPEQAVGTNPKTRTRVFQSPDNGYSSGGYPR